MEFALDYCQSKNHYFVAPDEAIPWSDPARLHRQLGYYHWVPITLLLQAFCFYLPSLLWNYACTTTGINFDGLLALAKTIAGMTLTDPMRQKHVDTLAKWIHDALGLDRLRLKRKRNVGCRSGRRIASYATMLYLFTKLLCVANVAAQFLLVNAFVGAPFTWWGWDVAKALMSGENWQDSPAFPRLSLCDVPIRGLGDSPYYTLQCHLRVNTYNEKVYFAIWWLFAFVAVSTACSFAYYALAFLWPWTREGNVRHLVCAKRHRSILWSSKKSDEEVMKIFADEGMQNDGTLLFWFIQGNANATVARDTMARIFDVYLWIREDKKLPADIAYNVLANLPVASPKKTGLSPSETISDNGNNNGGFGGFGDDGGTTIANSSSGFGGFGDDGGTTSGNNINGFGGFGSNIGGGWD